MSKVVENLLEAQQWGMSIRPKIGGFPYFAEALKRMRISRNIWSLPSCQGVYVNTTPFFDSIFDALKQPIRLPVCVR